MFRKSFLKVHNLITSVTHQARGFSQKAVQNHVSQYFCKAKLIDSIRVTLRYESIDSLLPVLEDPNLDSFVVANALRSAPSPESALSFVEALKRVPDFCHTQHSLNAIAKILAKSGRTSQLKKLIDAINAGDFPKVRPVSYMEKMRWYAAARDIDLVLRVWEELRSQDRCSPNVESYNIVMGLYVMMGKDLEAVQTFQSILQQGAFPNSRTFTIVIEHLLNSGNVENAMEVFYALPRMRVKRTLRQYSLLMESFLNSQQFAAVKSLVGEMKMEGVLPPRSMLLSLQRMCETGVLDKSDDFLKEIVPDDRIKNIKFCIDPSNGGDDEEDGDDCSSEADTGSVQLKPWLDPRALAKALQHWRDVDICALEDANLVWTSRLVCKMVKHFKSPQTAWQFFLWVANQPGYVHDIHTYSEMVKKLVRGGRIDLADDLLLKLKSKGLKMRISTVRQIVDFFGLFKEGDAALRIFRDVKVLCDDFSEFDRVLLYSSLLRTLLKCGRGCDAIETVKEMFTLGIYPDAQTFSGLMHHFAVRGDFRTVQRLFGMVKQCSVEPDAYMYKTLVRSYCKHGRATLALRLFEDMRNIGLIPDVQTKSLLVKSLWKEGRLREASTVEETCQASDKILPLPSTGQMFNISSADLRHVQNLYSDSFKDCMVKAVM